MLLRLVDLLIIQIYQLLFAATQAKKRHSVMFHARTWTWTTVRCQGKGRVSKWHSLLWQWRYPNLCANIWVILLRGIYISYILIYVFTKAKTSSFSRVRRGKQLPVWFFSESDEGEVQKGPLLQIRLRCRPGQLFDTGKSEWSAVKYSRELYENTDDSCINWPGKSRSSISFLSRDTL